jgi:hypothetical protein
MVQFMRMGNPIWSIFHYCNFFQISTDFELFEKFQVKPGLIEIDSYMLIATPIANPTELHFE